MENLENRLQRVEKALKSMTAPVRKIFDSSLVAPQQDPVLLEGKKSKVSILDYFDII